MFAAFGLSGCSYNELTAKQQNVRGKWANVESSLQRRADLIPNLVEAAKMAGVQEQEVFGQIADARSRLLNATAGTAGRRRRRQNARTKTGGHRSQQQLRRNDRAALEPAGKLSAAAFERSVHERPDRARGTENRINVARLDYNKAVTDYNTTRNSFPAVLTAGCSDLRKSRSSRLIRRHRTLRTSAIRMTLRRTTQPRHLQLRPIRHL